MGRAGQLHVSFNEEACREAKKYSGFFALVSNKTSNAFEALKIYRLREKFEECFHAPKQIEELGTEQVQYDEAILMGDYSANLLRLAIACIGDMRLPIFEKTCIQ